MSGLSLKVSNQSRILTLLASSEFRRRTHTHTHTSGGGAKTWKIHDTNLCPATKKDIAVIYHPCNLSPLSPLFTCPKYFSNLQSAHVSSSSPFLHRSLGVQNQFRIRVLWCRADRHGKDGWPSIVQSWQAVSECTLAYSVLSMSPCLRREREREKYSWLDEHQGEMEQELETDRKGSTELPWSFQTHVINDQYPSLSLTFAYTSTICFFLKRNTHKCID